MLDFICGAALKGFLTPAYFFTFCSFAITGLTIDIISEDNHHPNTNSSTSSDILLATQDVHNMHNDI